MPVFNFIEFQPRLVPTLAALLALALTLYLGNGSKDVLKKSARFKRSLINAARPCH
jgi:hypothetical protein